MLRRHNKSRESEWDSIQHSTEHVMAVATLKYLPRRGVAAALMKRFLHCMTSLWSMKEGITFHQHASHLPSDATLESANNER
jgi:hypothetical protein